MKRRKHNVIGERFMDCPPAVDIKEFCKELKAFHLYLVEVSYRVGNPVHLSVLFTGFQHGRGEKYNGPGGYWQISNNSSDQINLSGYGSWPRYIKVIRPLGSIKDRKLDA